MLSHVITFPVIIPLTGIVGIGVINSAASPIEKICFILVLMLFFASLWRAQRG